VIGGRILYYGGLWPTNIGNAFVDLGALHLLAAAAPGAQIYQASRFSRFYAQERAQGRHRLLRNSWRPFDVAEHAQVDWVVVAGNVTHSDFVRVEGPTIAALADGGARLVILGGGCSLYDGNEARAFRDFMHRVGVYAFVSRDHDSFETFRSDAAHVFPGVDCAFFLPEAVRPVSLSFGRYVVCAFDDQRREAALDLSGQTVVRARHYCYGVRERFTPKLDGTLVSDLPHDYLSLYAGAEVVYSDRVHACVAALAYGGKARLFSDTPRARLFDEVGAGGIVREVVRADATLLRERKRAERRFLSSLFERAPAVAGSG
jgi:polysaccharide pyruvyl transferase